jgi:hypothetical protein
MTPSCLLPRVIAASHKATSNYQSVLNKCLGDFVPFEKSARSDLASVACPTSRFLVHLADTLSFCANLILEAQICDVGTQ